MTAFHMTLRIKIIKMIILSKFHKNMGLAKKGR